MARGRCKLKVSILDASSLRKTLLRLIPKHDKIYMAVAWANCGPVADKLIENKRIEWARYRARVTDFELEQYLPVL